MNKLIKFSLGLFLSLILTSVTKAAVVDGVESGSVTLSATANSINFDPPCAFLSTLPLMGAAYMDPATQSVVIDGEGAVINECGNFGVTGYSAPNFLAWNCNTLNNDGTKPVLPLEMKFSRSAASISIKVASSSNAGSIARLRVYNAAHGQIGLVSATLTANAQTLSLVKTGIRYMRLEGPCVMIADDLAVTY
jgi:hypothetical protein